MRTVAGLVVAVTLIAGCGSAKSDDDPPAQSSVVFDVANSTFEVSRHCYFAASGGGPWLMTFVDGTANDKRFEDGYGHIKVTEEASVFELVAESPGPEVIASIDCWSGGTGTHFEIQVFAGHTTEAIRLGRIIESGLYHPFTFGLEGEGFHTKHWDWQGDDHKRTPSIYRIVQHTWVDGDWADEVDEAWERTIPPAGLHLGSW